MKNARGYILLEVMVAGMMAAVILASTLSFMAQARTETARGAREQTAASLARQSLERFGALPFNELNATNFVATEAISAMGPFTRTHVLSTSTETLGGVPTNAVSVVVTVSFALGSQTIEVTSRAKRYFL